MKRLENGAIDFNIKIETLPKANLQSCKYVLIGYMTRVLTGISSEDKNVKSVSVSLMVKQLARIESGRSSCSILCRDKSRLYNWCLLVCKAQHVRVGSTKELKSKSAVQNLKINLEIGI